MTCVPTGRNFDSGSHNASRISAGESDPSAVIARQIQETLFSLMAIIHCHHFGATCHNNGRHRTPNGAAVHHTEAIAICRKLPDFAELRAMLTLTRVSIPALDL
jgi:hypothetical protein